MIFRSASIALHLALIALISSSAAATAAPTRQEAVYSCRQATTYQACNAALLSCRMSVNDARLTQGSNPLGLATAFGDEARCRTLLGEYGEAEKLLRQEMELRRREHAEGQPDFATALHSLAAAIMPQGRYAEAESLGRQALKINIENHDKKHHKIAISQTVLAEIFEAQGNYKEAEFLYHRAAEINQNKFGKKHPNHALSLLRVGRVLRLQGRYAEAEPLLRDAGTLLRAALGSSHPDCIEADAELGALRTEQGHYKVARELLLGARSLSQSAGDAGAKYLNVKMYLGRLYALRGEYLLAERELRYVESSRIKASLTLQPEYIKAMNILAFILQKVGRYGEAEKVYRRAMAVLQSGSNGWHPLHSESLDGLASIALRRGRLEEAEWLLRQALDLQDKALSAQHPIHATTLRTLALLQLRQGKRQEAEGAYRQALRTLEQAGLKQHADYAATLNELGTALAATGRIQEAEQLVEQAAALAKQAVGAQHPLHAACLRRLALLKLAQGREALPLLEASIAIHEELLRSTVSEIRIRALLEQLREEEDTVYGLLLSRLQHAPTLQLATALALLRKGRSEDAGVRASFALRHGHWTPRDQELFTNWERSRRQREQLLLRGPEQLDPVVYQEKLEELASLSEQYEYSLVSENYDLRQAQPPALLRIVAEVAKQLPRDGALFELIWVRPPRFASADPSAESLPPRYLGLLLFPDARTIALDLGDAQELDTSVANLRKALQNPSEDPLPSAQRLYQQLFGGAQKELTNVRKLFVSPDGATSFVPFATLHDGKDYLFGRFEFHYLTVGRDLLRTPRGDAGRPSLLIGNPDFDRSIPYGRSIPKVTPSAGPSFYSLLRDVSSLPRTQREVMTLSKLLHKIAFTGDWANEERVREARAPYVLHIATHGIFMDDPPSAKRGGNERFGYALEEAQEQPELLTQVSNPLSRSALLLAGARNSLKASDTMRDGLLTAEEVRGLDLWGTRLVVLSACDTGRGGLSTGQGVFGLRRAFLIAGAETLVTSLWPVADDATQELMISYYTKLVTEQKPRIEAMEQAMRELRAKRPHPYYWAPFIVIGMDGPLGTPPSS